MSLTSAISAPPTDVQQVEVLCIATRRELIAYAVAAAVRLQACRGE